MSLQEQFEAAQKKAKSLPSRPSNEDLLKLYSLYKQATAGDVSGKRPGAFNFKERAKYDAWAGRKGTSKDDAMKAYVELVDKLAGG